MRRLTAALCATSACVALLVPTATGAAADPAAKAAASPIAGAYQTWTSRLESADCDGAKVAALYSRNAILLATFKTYVAGRHDITKYFDDLTCKEDLHVTTQRITSSRVGRLGYATGLYTFAYMSADGTKVEVPARFTFVFRLVGNTWLIVNHHSSTDPEAG